MRLNRSYGEKVEEMVLINPGLEYATYFISTRYYGNLAQCFIFSDRWQFAEPKINKNNAEVKDFVDLDETEPGTLILHEGG